MRIGATFNDQASPQLRELAADVKRATPIAIAGGRGVANKLRDHFVLLDEKPNRLGGRRTHFWTGVRGSVQQPTPVAPGVAFVAITNEAIRQKVEGGKIRAGTRTPGAKRIPIPATPEAYGKSPREFANLQLRMFRKRDGTLGMALFALRGVASNITLKRHGKSYKAESENIGMVPMFWLVKEVNQLPTPNALPSQAELDAAAQLGAQEYADNLTARANKGAATP